MPVIVYAARGGSILMFVGLCPKESLEELRQIVADKLEATHVWFSHEAGGPRDPIAGPYPTVGRRAEALAN